MTKLFLSLLTATDWLLFQSSESTPRPTADAVSSNPFAALASDGSWHQHVQNAQHRAVCPLCSYLQSQLADQHRYRLLWNFTAEICFGVTFDAERQSAVPLPTDAATPKYLAGLAELHPDQRLIGPDLIGQVLVDLLLTSRDIVPYSFRCYQSLNRLAESNPAALPLDLAPVASRLTEVISSCRSQLTGQVREFLANPEILTQCPVDLAARHLLELAISSGGNSRELPADVADFLTACLPGAVDSAGAASASPLVVRQFVAGVCRAVLRDERHFESLHCPLLTEPRLLVLLLHLARLPACARALLAASRLQQPLTVEGAGRQAQVGTVLGRLLSPSGLPQLGGVQQPDPLFPSTGQMSQRAYDAAERALWDLGGIYLSQVGGIFRALFRSAKRELLLWFAEFLEANAGKAKLAARHSMDPLMLGMAFASDGCCLNACAALLQLAGPLTDPRSDRLLLVDPRYVRSDRCPLRSLAKETPLSTGGGSGESPAQATAPTEPPHVLTELFFLCQRAVRLGFALACEKLQEVQQNLSRLQHAVQQQQPPHESHVAALERLTAHYLAHRASLRSPALLEPLLGFLVATSRLMVHFALADAPSAESAGTPSRWSDSLPDGVGILDACGDGSGWWLRLLPESLAEGVVQCAVFFRHQRPDMLEMSQHQLEPLFSFLLLFMGCPRLLRNPHLRASLAEGLCALCPLPGEEGAPQVPTYRRAALLESHPMASHTAAALLSVFVSIELSGESVQFEMKFSYRRPMYSVLHCLWSIPSHREQICLLARLAMERLDDTEAPLFLKFLNLLLNDATFLLDEALGYLAQLKSLELRRQDGQWPEYGENQRERQEAEAQFLHTARLTRFHNQLSQDTLKALELLTEAPDVLEVLLHPMLADRVAGTLNYFLAHLAGPKQSELTVRDKSAYQFKPRELLASICRLLVNLSSGGEAFLSAVVRDSRSYSPGLMQAAASLLERVADPGLADAFARFAESARLAEAARQAEDESAEDAPEEFIDPIMGTLMRDPVVLPASRVTVDRATIQRHLLSDPTDPFNRQPLTMSQVTADEDLRDRVRQWLAEKQKH